MLLLCWQMLLQLIFGVSKLSSRCWVGFKVSAVQLLPGLKPICSGVRRDSTLGFDNLISFIHSVCVIVGRLLCSFWDLMGVSFFWSGVSIVITLAFYCIFGMCLFSSY